MNVGRREASAAARENQARSNFASEEIRMLLLLLLLLLQLLFNRNMQPRAQCHWAAMLGVISI